MRVVSRILGLAIACVVTPALAKPAYIASTVNLRAAPGTGSEIVAKIPGGSLVDTGGGDEGGWEITLQDKKRFSTQTPLAIRSRGPRQPAAAPGSPSCQRTHRHPRAPGQ